MIVVLKVIAITIFNLRFIVNFYMHKTRGIFIYATLSLSRPKRFRPHGGLKPLPWPYPTQIDSPIRVEQHQFLDFAYHPPSLKPL